MCVCGGGVGRLAVRLDDWLLMGVSVLVGGVA